MARRTAFKGVVEHIDADLLVNAFSLLDGATGKNPVSVDINHMQNKGEFSGRSHPRRSIEVPVTQSVIYGWYDNELGSYTNMLGDRTVSIARLMHKDAPVAAAVRL